MPIKTYQGKFEFKEANHLLKRCLFGPKLTEINSFVGLNVSTAVDFLLQDIPLPKPPVNNYNDATNTDSTVSFGQTWINAPYQNGTINSRRVTSLKSWWIMQMMNQTVSIREKMVLFWHNHFATEAGIVNDARFLYKHCHLLRRFALGNFKTLVKEITIDPAMLKYLNGYLNSKTAPDENYARELQELFTLGKGPNSKFTENDVKAAAKILTGYRLDNEKIISFFDANRHDTTDKQFSSFYNNKIIKGRTGLDGVKELDDLIDMIFEQKEVSLYICRKLYRFFVYYDIDDEIETTIISPLAEILRNNNYEIKPVLKALFTSDLFYSSESISCNIKSPIDFTVGLCREYEVVFPIELDVESHYHMANYIRTTAANFQQNLGDPPSVSGWESYYQIPQFYELWINSDTLPKRNAFTDRMISSGYTRNGKKLIIDFISYTKQFPKADDPNLLIDDVLKHLYTLEVSSDTKKFLKSILLSNQALDSYWTTAWNNYIREPQNTSALTIVTTRLKEFYKYIMNLEEYQLS
jgi:uncharacterized protein (DUF1800 family)